MGITSAALTKIVATGCEMPEATVRDRIQRLRKDPAILRPGRQGPSAPALSESEVVNVLIGLCCAVSTGRNVPDAVETVRAIRDAQRVRHPDIRCDSEAIEGLSIGAAETVGEALDGLVRDMRDGAYERWAGFRFDETFGTDSPPPVASVDVRFIDSGRDTVINVRRGMATAALLFRQPSSNWHWWLRHNVELNGHAFEAIAVSMR